MVNLDAMVAPSFYSLAWDIVEHHHSNYWLKGGRGSTKSSFVSLMIVLGIMADQSHEANAVVMRRYATNLR